MPNFSLDMHEKASDLRTILHNSAMPKNYTYMVQQEDVIFDSSNADEEQGGNLDVFTSQNKDDDSSIISTFENNEAQMQDNFFSQFSAQMKPMEE